MFIIEFFRDTISGPLYFIYLIICLIIFFALLGVVGDRKRYEIEEKLKAKKKYDIESGKEAEIAALESKQVLDVLTEEKQEEITEEVKEEQPSVIVLDSTNTESNSNN